jgi:hypothetical protein
MNFREVKTRAFWLAVTLVISAALFLVLREDLPFITGPTQIVSAIVVAHQPGRDRAELLHAVYAFRDLVGLEHRVISTTGTSWQPAPIGSAETLIYPVGLPDQARPSGIAMRGLFYLLGIGLLILSISQLFARQDESDPD